MGVLRGAAHRAGHPDRQGGGDDAGLFIQKRLVLGVVVPAKPGGPGFRCQVRLLQLIQFRLLAAQRIHVRRQAPERFPAVQKGLLLPLELFLFGTDGLQAFALFLEGGDFSGQRGAAPLGILLGRGGVLQGFFLFCQLPGLGVQLIIGRQQKLHGCDLLCDGFLLRHCGLGGSQ